MWGVDNMTKRPVVMDNQGGALVADHGLTTWPLLGELIAVVAAALLLLPGSTVSHGAGWVLGALVTSSFFAVKSYYDLRLGRRMIYVRWVEIGSRALLAAGLVLAFAHAFALATEWAK